MWLRLRNYQSWNFTHHDNIASVYVFLMFEKIWTRMFSLGFNPSTAIDMNICSSKQIWTVALYSNPTVYLVISDIDSVQGLIMRM